MTISILYQQVRKAMEDPNRLGPRALMELVSHTDGDDMITKIIGGYLVTSNWWIIGESHRW